MTIGRRSLMGAAVLAPFAPTISRAQGTADTARLLAGFSPGGAIDVVARRLAERLNGKYARSVVVENRTGAGGRLAVEAAKNAVPDGLTMVVTPGSMLYIYPWIYRDLSYDPVRDLAPVSLVARVAMTLVVGPMVPASVRTVPDFLAWARANPSHANFGTGGAGSMPHFVGAMLGKVSGAPLTHVPFRGTAAAITDLIGGQIPAVIGPEADMVPHLRGGQVRLLATSGAERSRFNPNTPTFSEQGLPELVLGEWFAAFMPSRTPEATVARANAALKAALQDPVTVSALAELGFDAAPSTPEELGAMLRRDLAYWEPIVKASGFTASD